MLPAQLAETIIKLGICYQFHVEQRELADLLGFGMPQKDEDFSDIGYNKDEEPQEERPKPIKGKVITDFAELQKYDGWHLSLKIPKEIPETFVGPRYQAFITKRKLLIKGDDFPWTMNALRHTFALEYIKDVKLAGSVLIILTSFGQTGISIN